MFRSSDIDIAKIEVLRGNLFHVTIKTGVELDLDATKRLIEATNALLDETTPYRGSIYDISGITYIHEEAREYLASGTKAKGTTVAVALISTSFLGRTVGNMVISFSEDKNYPVRFFESHMSAEHWVRNKLKAAKESGAAGSIGEVA